MHPTRADGAGDHALQRRTVRTLMGAQVLGSLGLASGIAVGSLLAEDLLGSADLAGLGGTFQVLGGALIAIPMARVMAARGRRPGLVLGHGLALVGAVVIVAAGATRSFPLLLLGSLLFGGATTTSNQARYAAADLAEERHRGRDLSLVVWATTVGAVAGPNVLGPAGDLARALGLPPLTGPFLVSIVGFVLAVAVVLTRLRPDPLLVARALEGAPGDDPAQPHGSVLRGLRVARSVPEALVGLVTVALGHATMVSVMVMTPLHLSHGGAELRVIGLVISIHIVGMFAFSPLVGLGVDRVGARPVAIAASAVLVGASLLAAQAPAGWSPGLAVGLFLLGLGWSGTLVSGSTLLTSAVPAHERAGVQGASELAMGLAAGGGGALAGVVVAQLGYAALGVGAALLAAGIAATVALVPHAPRRQTAGPGGVR